VILECILGRTAQWDTAMRYRYPGAMIRCDAFEQPMCMQYVGLKRGS
jgi:hypothetical protein